MKNSEKGVIGVLAILILVVVVSGCTSTEKLLFQYNLSAGESPNLLEYRM